MQKYIVKNGLRYYKNFSGQELTLVGFDTGIKLDRLYIPASIEGAKVVRIDESAFYNSSIKFLVLPEHIEKIEKNAFAKCIQLNRVQFYKLSGFKESVNLIFEEKAFDGCLSLQEVSGCENRTAVIRKNAFHDCCELFTCSFKIQELEAFAFSQCHNLETLNFTNITWLKSHCLQGTSVKTIIMPKTGIIDSEVLQRIKDYNIKIKCQEISPLANLAYEGYDIEVL